MVDAYHQSRPVDVVFRRGACSCAGFTGGTIVFRTIFAKRTNSVQLRKARRLAISVRIFIFRCFVACTRDLFSCSLKDTTVPEAGDSPPPPYSEGPGDKCATTTVASAAAATVVATPNSKNANQLPRYEELKPLANGFFI